MSQNNIFNWQNNWQNNLTKEDYEFLMEYLENIKNGVKNDKLVILHGPGKSGKSTLKQAIALYLGNGICGSYPMSCEIICYENIKPLVLLCGLDDVYREKNTNRAIINLVKYKQSIIAEVNDIAKISSEILSHARVLNLTPILSNKFKSCVF